MTRFTSTALLAALVGSCNAFTIAPPFQQRATALAVSSVSDQHQQLYFADEDLYFASVTEVETRSEALNNFVPQQPVAVKQPKKKPAAGHKQDGLFAPVVVMAKKVLGDEQLNKVRGKAIGLHSDVIGKFVNTADSKIGEAAIQTLFTIADKDKNGVIDEDELNTALRALGFKHLKDKQIAGIFARADLDKNGALDFEEFKKEAPKTLRTNLIKLAKSNGGELGFLA